MIRWAIGWLVAIVATSFAMPAAEAMSADSTYPPIAYAHNVTLCSVSSDSTAPERAPPSIYDLDRAQEAVDCWSNGASACPAIAAIHPDTAYDTLAGLATAAPTGTTVPSELIEGELSSFQRSRVAAKYGDDAIEGIGDARSYVNLTQGGSIRNVGTNTTHTEFAGTLTSGGWVSRTSKDGAVQIFQRDGAKYVLRSKNSSGYAGWTADFTPAGSTRHTLEIRLGYAP